MIRKGRNVDRIPNPQYSRRNLLKGAGVGVLSLALGNSNALAAIVGAGQGISPTDLLNATTTVQDYLRMRSTGRASVTDLQKFIDPGAQGLLNWERNRLDIFNSLNHSAGWSAQFESVSSIPVVVDAFLSGGVLRVHVYEWISINWRSIPKKNLVISPEELALRAQYPDKYGVKLPADRLINSGLGVTHKFSLAKQGSNWSIISDGYDERGVAGISPDYIPEISNIGSSNLRVTTPQEPVVEPRLTQRTFDYQAAIAYATTWCGALGANNMTTQLYNAQYHAFVGDDCADFVSQCFLTGLYPADSSWFYTSISGTAISPSLTGTPTRTGVNSSPWINNSALRNWLISSGRGVAMSSISALGLADIINYSNGPGMTPFHVMIVSNIDAHGNRCLSGHSSNQKNWIYFPGAYAPVSGDLYTTTLLYYNA